ncbi:hypothetical protein K9857_15125 [Pseudomonas sp. REP124]|uniref:hypothetical protein n=1 Tax=Pseudomonas sp. REP124 TaxID=2875731 RepID=UPI001CC8F81F|nr:hypothetical protein [Pseudomonas sp. REP124]MBZ9782868.1 hypothetical protein [Pseudomonas sp. REP124]
MFDFKITRCVASEFIQRVGMFVSEVNLVDLILRGFMSSKNSNIDIAFMKVCSLDEGIDFSVVSPFLSLDELLGYERIMVDSVLAAGQAFLETASIKEIRKEYVRGLMRWVGDISLDRKAEVLLGLFGVQGYDSIVNDSGNITI